MDHLRAILVPFRPTTLLMIGLFTLLITFILTLARSAGLVGIWGLVAALLLDVWVLKYCYVLIEHVADGAREPPVMDTDMLSPFEIRPWLQAMLLGAGAMLCYKVGGDEGRWLAVAMLALFPASAALLAMGENVFQAMNPLAWWRVIRGFGPYYLGLLCVLAAIGGIYWLMFERWHPPLIVLVGVTLFCQVGFFGLIGSGIWIRRRQLGFEPSRSPERAAAREENERVKVRKRMLDDLFQQVRVGNHVDATAPLAAWLGELDQDLAVRDSLHVAERALDWDIPAALNPIGSTLIRHLLRFGRPDAALKVFELFRRRSAQFTMDSAADLRNLAEFAESVGKDELAQAMRLETPVFHPSPGHK
jgi:hypothetical protein